MKTAELIGPALDWAQGMKLALEALDDSVRTTEYHRKETPMRVFIWVQYGEVDVYPAETEEQLDNLFNSIVDCLDDWGLESEISKAERFLEKNNRSPEHLVKAVQYLLGKIHISSHEQFERGTGFKHMREAIEQSEKQEPVAQYTDIVSDGGFDPRNKFDAAPPKREWIGLTDDDIESIICDMIDRKEYGATDIARLAEQLLKEKNHG